MHTESLQFLTHFGHKEITAKEAQVIIPDSNAREKALNFLLGVGLLKTLVDANRKVSFRAVTKGELDVYVVAELKAKSHPTHDVLTGQRT